MMKTERVRVTLRLDPILLAALKDRAKRLNMSLNRYVEMVLEREVAKD